MKCKYGFYTCQFIGLADFCNSCDGGQNYQMKKQTRGGKRAGAGRKSIYKEPTKQVKVTCPVSKIEELKKIIDQHLNFWIPKDTKKPAVETAGLH